MKLAHNQTRTDKQGRLRNPNGTFAKKPTKMSLDADALQGLLSEHQKAMANALAENRTAMANTMAAALKQAMVEARGVPPPAQATRPALKFDVPAYKPEDVRFWLKEI